MRKIYADLLSQPARACVIFCRSTGIEFDLVPVAISKGEHLQKEYKAINPLGKIPCLTEDDFTLAESGAILRYLANSHHIADHWYPAEARARAKVDCALDWHHNNVRRGCAGLVKNTVFAASEGQSTDSKSILQFKELLMASLNMLESIWLAQHEFVAGDKISIADLIIVTELDELQLLGPIQKGILAPFPKVQAWMSTVASTTFPYHADASLSLQTAAQEFAQRV